jgi:transforming growth factor-beta-induced protein
MLRRRQIMKRSEGLSRRWSWVLVLGLMAVPVMAAHHAPAAAAGHGQDKDIVDTAVAAGSFRTLVKAVQAAGLVQTLKGPGPFTVFAPTDEAFAKLPEATLASLLEPANRGKLAEILTYHVVPGRVTAAAAAKIPRADTVQGTSVLIAADGKHVRIDGAKVLRADIHASNGIIHVIDQVIVPKDIVATAATAGQFNTLLAAAKAAGLVDALKAPGANLTVLAPTDEAFAKLPKGTVESLLEPANRGKLAAILKYHVLPRRLTLGRVEADTLHGGKVAFRPAGPIRVGQANVLVADIKATNGVIHVIDRVLLPADGTKATPHQAMAMIEHAVRRGAPLYNAGHRHACAAIYEKTVQSLLDTHGESLGAAGRTRLHKAMREARNHRHASAKAWAFRRALDDVYRAMRDGTM